MASKKLATYRKKRDFTKTAEPSGERTVTPSKTLRFVIQKHAATRLHYDLRLELDGVFKSWAVTKGPSLNPKDKRLAVEVEDHPLDYGDFEGTIPKGEYGGGTVQIWDRGHWLPEGDAEKALKKGELKFALAGEKLNGGYVLVRIKNDRTGNTKRNNWLLIKHKDEYVQEDGDAVQKPDKSVASGRKMKEIEAGSGQRPSPFMLEKPGAANAVWHSNKSKATPSKRSPRKRAGKGAAMPEFVEPQLCQSMKTAPTASGWGHEIKFDGYRMQLRVDGGKGRLSTRKGLDWSAKFPEIVEAAKELEDGIYDGEVVALDDASISNFASLQLALSEGKTEDLVFYAFDLLFHDGEDLRALPLSKRKERLKAALPGDARLRFTDHLTTPGDEVWAAACRMKLEGIISKRLDAPYRSGRTGSWTKSKCRLGHEVVIGGWSHEHGRFRSLLVGARKGRELIYSGRVGTGFTQKSGQDLAAKLKKIERVTSPFANAPRAKDVRWVEPTLVAEIEFASWTRDGLVRQAAFKGLRTDKPAREVTVEEPVPADRAEAAMPKKSARASTIIRKASKDLDVLGVAISKPDKALWPTVDGEPGTKRDLALYLEAVADWVLPHIKGRPCSIVRAPDGISGQHFFQRHLGVGASKHYTVAKVSGDRQPYLQIDTAEALIAAGQSAALEFHPWNCAPNNYEEPGRLVFDLDPGPDVPFQEVVAAAKELNERLEAIGLVGFCKTTGGKGLHVVTPLAPARGGVATWPVAKAFARAVCEAMADDAPDRFLINMSKRKRVGRIFLDYLRNDRMSTAVAPLSPRARHGGPVSMPLTWGQVRNNLDPAAYTIRTAPKLIAKSKAWDGYDEAARPLADAIKHLTKPKSHKQRQRH